MLESRGIATIVIGLVRRHMEQTRPPRGLFVPFQLGRPLGEPEDPAFQHRVLAHALGLLERADGPVILEDFPEDAPNWHDTPGWTPPDLPACARPDTPDGWRVAFAAELAALRPAWDAARGRFGRSSVGLTAREPEEWPAICARFLAGETPPIPPIAAPALGLRHLCDDIKALYGEAAQATGRAPSARQVDGWFWRESIAGKMLLALRAVALGSPSNALRTAGGRFFVPAPYLAE
jgi:hypothetical protein